MLSIYTDLIDLRFHEKTWANISLNGDGDDDDDEWPNRLLLIKQTKISSFRISAVFCDVNNT